MTRRLDELMRQRPDAFDAGDTPQPRGLKTGYLDKAIPPHVKAALKAKAAARRKVSKDPTEVENDAASVSNEPLHRAAVVGRKGQAELQVEKPAARRTAVKSFA